MNQYRVVLDPTLRSIDAQEFERQLRERVVGQDPAVEKLTLAFQTFLAGFNAPGKPVGSLIFLGPAGFRTQNLGTTGSPPPPASLALSPSHCHQEPAKKG
jgi:hypothetical protein